MTPKLFKKVENAMLIAKIEGIQADLERANAIIEYLSMMTDIEIPSEEEEDFDHE